MPQISERIPFLFAKKNPQGSEDADGFLRITGRLKEILITAGGENLAPAPLEAALRMRLSPLVSHAVAVGDKRRFVSCLLAPKTLLVSLNLNEFLTRKDFVQRPVAAAKN